MRWWAFHEEQLESELAKREAERVEAGAGLQVAKEESATIKGFLLSVVKQWGGKD